MHTLWLAGKRTGEQGHTSALRCLGRLLGVPLPGLRTCRPHEAHRGGEHQAPGGVPAQGGGGGGGTAHHSALLSVASAHDGLTKTGPCKAQQTYNHLMMMPQSSVADTQEWLLSV